MKLNHFWKAPLLMTLVNISLELGQHGVSACLSQKTAQNPTPRTFFLGLFILYLHVIVRLRRLNGLIASTLIHHLQFPELQHERNQCA